MVPAESSPNPTQPIEEISMSLVSDKFPKKNFQDNRGPLGGYYLLKFFANMQQFEKQRKMVIYQNF